MVSGEEILSKFKGAAAGPAVGAAVGKAAESVPADAVFDYYGRAITGLEKPHPSSPYDYLKPEEVPASVELFRLALESLVEAKGFDPYDFMARVLDWVASTQVHKYLEPTILNTALALLQEQPLSEVVRRTTSIDAILHTSAMGIYHFDNPVVAAEGARAMAKLFAEGREVEEGSQVLGAAVSLLIDGDFDLGEPEENKRFLKELIESCPELEEGKKYLQKVEEALQRGLSAREAVLYFGNGEYVWEALPLALYLFLADAKYPQKAFLNAVNAYGEVGGATAALGFMVGQWIGAYWGVEVFPPEWIEKVEHAKELIKLAEKLYELLFG
jgi:ADP-ribosylglycohydrolase